MKVSRSISVFSRAFSLVVLLSLSRFAPAQTPDDAVAGLFAMGQLLSQEVDFAVAADNDKVNVSWTVPAEGGIAAYEIYRTTADRSAVRICTFKAVQSTRKATYAFNDFYPSAGANSYQLVMVTKRGERVFIDTTTVASR
jgi:hypothetical protein